MDNTLTFLKYKLLFVIFLVSTAIHGQIEIKNLSKKERTCYWFYINIGKDGDFGIRIKTVDYHVRSGYLKDFIEDHGSALKSGQIAVGPFAEEYNAKHAQSLYRIAGKGGKIPVRELEEGEEEPDYNFFYIKPVSEDFQNDINLAIIPSRVTNGDIELFVAMLEEGLGFGHLAIGPFDDYVYAEKSKFAYGRKKKAALMDATDSLRMRNLKRMEAKWRSLNLKMSKKYDNKKNKVSTYRFSTRFPSRYFDPHAVQVFTIRASYSDAFEYSENSFTLQGESVTDNNYSIAYSMGTIYVNLLHFDWHGSGKTEGFLIESFIYNNIEMIELDPVYIKMK